MACESLRSGDCKMALAGGVNALLLPDFYVAFSQLGVLSPDGRCKTFDARANGYVRSEGAGMVLLKPLREAQRDGDPIYAVIRATALNQDGRTQGMTVPSQLAQETLLRTACRQAGVKPSQIQYVEAHGTGTPVGDPIEANALASVLNQDRPADQPCSIGSVKTNIGHLEAGAGIASLIKVALSLHHREIPAHLHFEQPNPQIDFERLKLQIPRKTEPWKGIDGKRLAGINGFGYGGANAHVLVQEAPRSIGEQSNGHAPSNVSSSSFPVLLPVSARCPKALGDVARSIADWLEGKGSEFSLEQIAGFAAHRRSHQESRHAVHGRTRQQWIRGLRDLADADEPVTGGRAHPSKTERGVLFVCSGQGPQWWAMGRGLLEQ